MPNRNDYLADAGGEKIFVLSLSIAAEMPLASVALASPINDIGKAMHACEREFWERPGTVSMNRETRDAVIACDDTRRFLQTVLRVPLPLELFVQYGNDHFAEAIYQHFGLRLAISPLPDGIIRLTSPTSDHRACEVVIDAGPLTRTP